MFVFGKQKKAALEIYKRTRNVERKSLAQITRKEVESTKPLSSNKK